MNKWLSDTWTVCTSGGGWPLVRQLIFDNTGWINLNKANYYNNHSLIILTAQPWIFGVSILNTRHTCQFVQHMAKFGLLT